MPVFPFVPEPSWLTAAAQAGRREGEESCELVCVSGAGGRGTGKPGLVKSRVFQIGISDSEIGLYLISRQMSLH